MGDHSIFRTLIGNQTNKNHTSMKALIQCKPVFYINSIKNIPNFIVNFTYKLLLNFIFTLTKYLRVKPHVMSLSFLLFSFQAIGQNPTPQTDQADCRPVIHRINLGVKAGLPGIVSAGAEVVTPLLQNRVAPFVEISRLKTDYESASIGSRFLEYGVNLYFSDKGRRGYLTVSRSSLMLKGLEEHPDGVNAETSFAFRGTNVKLGGRWGSRVYFRLEAGFTFGKVPQGLEVTEINPEGGSSSEYEAFPETATTLTEMGLPVFNIGMGVSL